MPPDRLTELALRPLFNNATASQARIRLFYARLRWYAARARPFLVVDLPMKSEITSMHNQRSARGRKSRASELVKERRYPIGAELIGPEETHFRVWAPKAQHVDLVLEESAEKNAKRTFHPLEAEDGGYFSG